MLAREPELAGRVSAAPPGSASRRWNLRLDNGVDVKLPADSPQAAWALLARLEREQSLLARDVSVIDLRLPDRLVVPARRPAAELRRQPEPTDTHEGGRKALACGKQDSAPAADLIGRPRRRHHQGLLLHRAASARTASRRSSASAISSPAACAAAPSSTWRRPRPRSSTAVHAAEQMAGETLRDVTVNVAGGHPASQTIGVEVAIAGHEVGDADLRRVLDQGQVFDASAGPPADPLDPRRLHHRRQPRHPRSPRHVRRAPGRRHACRHRGRRPGAQPQHLHRPLPSRHPLSGRLALCRRPGDAWWTTRWIWASPSSTWAAAPPRSPSSSTATWSIPTASRSAASTSPATSRAACRRRSPMPSA